MKSREDKIMDSLTFQLHEIQTLNRQNLHPISSNNRTSYIAKITFNPNPNKYRGLGKPFNEIVSKVSGIRIFSDSNYSSVLFISKYLFDTLQWFKAHPGAAVFSGIEDDFDEKFDSVYSSINVSFGSHKFNAFKCFVIGYFPDL